MVAACTNSSSQEIWEPQTDGALQEAPPQPSGE